MKLFIIPILILCMENNFAFDLPRENCLSELKINNRHYHVSTYYHIGEAYPTDAHYDVFGNLFFVESRESEEGYSFNVKVIKFKTTDPESIPGLPENSSYSVAIDKNEKNVYFGTGHGIYRYNYEAHNATPISNTIKLDMILIDKDSNKYITENIDGIEELYLLDGEEKIRFNSLESLNELAIDEKNNFYYIRENSFYVLKASHSIPICIGNITYDGMAQIAVHNNIIFVVSNSLMYLHENDTGTLKLVENAPENITAIAFDGTGDFILGVHGKIIKYKKKYCPFRINNEALNVIGVEDEFRKKIT